MRSYLLSSHLDVIGNISPRLCYALEVLHLSYLLLSAYKSLFLVCLKVLRFLLIHSLFNFSGGHSFHSSDVELQLMDVADDIMTYIEISLVYWNKQSS
jgi:hypothetical protein